MAFAIKTFSFGDNFLLVLTDIKFFYIEGMLFEPLVVKSHVILVNDYLFQSTVCNPALVFN